MKVAELFEARSPDLKYTEKRVKNVLDRVTIELEGNQSGMFTKLSSKYEILDEQAKIMAKCREEVNAQMKDKILSLFDAEDEVLTRVIETVSYTLTLSKSEKKEGKPDKIVIDYEKIVKELEEMVPELTEKIKEITKKYTTIVPPTDTVPKLTFKSKVAESVLDTLKALGAKFLSYIKSWGKGYDKRLAALKKQLS